MWTVRRSAADLLGATVMDSNPVLWIVLLAVIVWTVSKIEKAERRGRMRVGGILLLIAVTAWLLFMIFTSAGCAEGPPRI